VIKQSINYLLQFSVGHFRWVLYIIQG